MHVATRVTGATADADDAVAAAEEDELEGKR
jgi:hypothetical protein